MDLLDSVWLDSILAFFRPQYSSTLFLVSVRPFSWNSFDPSAFCIQVFISFCSLLSIPFLRSNFALDRSSFDFCVPLAWHARPSHSFSSGRCCIHTYMAQHSVCTVLIQNPYKLRAPRLDVCPDFEASKHLRVEAEQRANFDSKAAKRFYYWTSFKSTNSASEIMLRDVRYRDRMVCAVSCSCCRRCH